MAPARMTCLGGCAINMAKNEKIAVLFIVMSVLLMCNVFMTLNTEKAYADLYYELDNDYDGDIWRYYVNDDSSVDVAGTNDSVIGALSISLLMNDIYQYNTQLALIGQSPAGQAALQVSQLDFIRGAYGRLTDLYKLQSKSILPALNDLRSNTANLNNMYDYVVDCAANTLAINTNMTVANQHLNNLVRGLSSVSSDLVLINENASGIYTQQLQTKLAIWSLADDMKSYFHPDPQGDGSVKGYFWQFAADLFYNQNQIMSKINTANDTLTDIASRIGYTNTMLNAQATRDDYHYTFMRNSIDALSTAVNNIEENTDDILGNATVLDTGSSSNKTLGYFLSAILQELRELELIVNVPENDYSEVVSAISEIKTLLNDNFPIEYPEYPTFDSIVNSINAFKTSFDNFANQFKFSPINGTSSLRVFIPYINEQGSVIPWVSIRNLTTYYNNLTNILNNVYSRQSGQLDNIYGLMTEIRDLLKVANPDEVIGDFNDVQFNENVDDLTAKLATVAPFGALLMVSAELDIMQSVTAVREPVFNIPFNFFGNSNVNIDLGFMQDARPLFNFIVVFGFVYMLLIYTIDFIKQGEL